MPGGPPGVAGADAGLAPEGAGGAGAFEPEGDAADCADAGLAPEGAGGGGAFAPEGDAADCAAARAGDGPASGEPSGNP